MSGGPYGLEDTIGEAGAGMGLLLIIITPIIWSLPTALMVAEMATMMPVEGGYYYWGKTALGPFWGFNLGLVDVGHELGRPRALPGAVRRLLVVLLPDPGGEPAGPMAGGGDR